MRTPQKIKTYYLGMVFGRSNFLEMNAINMLRMTLVIDETTEAATCNMLVIKIMLEIDEQKALTLLSEYMTPMLSLQKQNFA